MKELFHLIVTLDLDGLFKKTTNNGFLQFFRYIFVGGIATIADWGVLFTLDSFFPKMLYFSVALSFIVGLCVNFLLSKKFVFHTNTSGFDRVTEFMIYLVTGLIGLGLTELIMFVSVELLDFGHMLSKVIATILVLAWNFGSKKILLKRKCNK